MWRSSEVTTCISCELQDDAHSNTQSRSMDFMPHIHPGSSTQCPGNMHVTVSHTINGGSDVSGNPTKARHGSYLSRALVSPACLILFFDYLAFFNRSTSVHWIDLTDSRIPSVTCFCRAKAVAQPTFNLKSLTGNHLLETVDLIEKNSNRWLGLLIIGYKHGLKAKYYGSGPYLLLYIMKIMAPIPNDQACLSKTSR